MHYFKRNIGDYHKKAGRLSMLEHGAYTLLMDAYYDREAAPTKELAIDWCWARSPEEIAAVEFVLSKFFDLDGDVYRQSRIDQEIEKYHQNAKTNKRIAREREEKKRAKRARIEHEPCTDEHEPTPNHKPRTKNQEPRTKNKNTPHTPQGDLFDQFWQAYPKKVGKDAARRSWKKIKSPTETLSFILKALEWQKKSEAWTKDGGQYIPNPSTYLNQGRWQDEPVKSKGNGSAPLTYAEEQEAKRKLMAEVEAVRTRQ